MKEIDEYMTLYKLQNTNRPDILAVRRRVDEISTTDPDVLNFNMTRQFHRVQQGKYALLLGTIFSFLGNTNNQLEVIDSKHGTAFLAFHIPRSSPFKHELEKWYVRLIDLYWLNPHIWLYCGQYFLWMQGSSNSIIYLYNAYSTQGKAKIHFYSFVRNL